MTRLQTALLLVVLLVGSASAESPARELATGNKQFACDLYARLAKRDGNLFFSPYSISTCLGMVRAGAVGRTAEEMDAVLHFPEDPIGPRFRELGEERRLWWELNRDRIGEDRSSAHFVLANRLFGSQRIPVLAPFRSALERDFEAGVELLDFGDANQAAVRINSWIAKKTRNLIPRVVEPRDIHRDQALVLVNALYFHDSWLNPFMPPDTEDAPFRRSDGTTVQTPLMHGEARFRYAETEDLQVIEMPYLNSGTSMVVVLPRAPDGLEAIEAAVGSATLTKWLGGGSVVKVRVTFPRFRADCRIDLAETLEAMGMASAFEIGEADFSRAATSKPPPYLGFVAHRAVIEVDEIGTKAAAATAAGAICAGRPRPEEPKTFTADRPFLFFIREAHSDTILFLGRVTDPTAR